MPFPAAVDFIDQLIENKNGPEDSGLWAYSSSRDLRKGSEQAPHNPESLTFCSVQLGAAQLRK